MAAQVPKFDLRGI